MRAFIKFPILLCAVLLSSACGVKTAYNNADWLMMRWIDERVSLTAEQELAARTALEAHLQWHCTSELPTYAQLLRSIQADITRDRITIETLEDYGSQAAELGQRLLVRIRPSLIDLFTTLEDRQVADLMASFEERNRELREQARLGEDALIRERARGMESGMKRFTGRLTRDQRTRLHSWAAGLEATAKLELEHRLTWQSRLAEALALRHDRPAFETAMAPLLQPGATEPEALAERRLDNRERTLEVVVALHRQAPDRQIDHLNERLTDLADDLEELSCL